MLTQVTGEVRGVSVGSYRLVPRKKRNTALGCCARVRCESHVYIPF